MGFTGPTGIRGQTGPAGQNAAISSVFLWSNTSQTQSAMTSFTLTGTIAGTTLTVTATTGVIRPGMIISGGAIVNTTQITALGTGTGGIGTYTVFPSQTVSSLTITALYPQFQEIAFEQTPIGPPGFDWTVVPSTNNTRFVSNTTGWYLMTYKLDVRTNSPLNFSYTRTAAALMMFDGSNWTEIIGSGSAAQAPDTNHQYSISNTVLVYYVAQQQIALQWWGGYYSGSSATLQTTVTGLSIGPNNTASNEIPWIPGTFNPDGAVYDKYNEASASLVITRIVDTS